MHVPVLKYLPALIICAVIVFLLPACQRQESNKPEGRRQAQQVNENRDIPLANESAYDTVLRELKKNPDDIKALYHLGDLYFRDGLYEKAIANFRKVVAAEPSRGYVFLQMGTALNRLQRFDEALDALTQAIAKLKDPTVAYNNIGITYGKLGRYQEEIDAMKKAIKLRPRYASARYNLGVTLIKVGDLDGAREQYRALNEFDVTIAKALLDEINKATVEPSRR